MKDAAGDKFINYNPMPETKPYPRAKPKVRVDVYKRQIYQQTDYIKQNFRCSPQNWKKDLAE